MLDWLSDNRALVAAVIILCLVGSFFASIFYGLKQTRLREKDQVFGDPERTVGGWFWAVCGVSTLLLVWFYFSWGSARAFFPQAANELCQVAKLHGAVSPVTSSLAIESRYSKSKTLLVRNSRQLDELQARLPVNVFSPADAARVTLVMQNTQQLISMMATPDFVDQKTIAEIQAIKAGYAAITSELANPKTGWTASTEALAQPSWGITEPEIPMLPVSAKGAMYDALARDAAAISKDYLKIRNLAPAAKVLIAETKAMIAALKKSPSMDDGDPQIVKERADYMKAVDRIFKRIDDGKIFPAVVMAEMQVAVQTMLDQADRSKGSLGIVEMLFFPAGDIVKSRTQCTEQGPGRWLPKPTDVVATFFALANPDVENGGGYKGTTLLWWKWLPISDVVSFVIPDALIDLLPGDYGRLNDDGRFEPNYKDWMLALAQGDVYLGAIPMLDGHIWDSLFRVLVAMFFGVLLGVPLGIYMGVSRFCKSFFDPMIELYRPVPTSNLYNWARTDHHHSAGRNHREEDRSARPESRRTQHLKSEAISTIIGWCLCSRHHFPHQDWQAQKTWQQHRLVLATSDLAPVLYIACVISQYRQLGKTAFRQSQGCLLTVRPDQASSEQQPAFRP